VASYANVLLAVMMKNINHTYKRQNNKSLSEIHKHLMLNLVRQNWNTAKVALAKNLVAKKPIVSASR